MIHEKTYVLQYQKRGSLIPRYHDRHVYKVRKRDLWFHSLTWSIERRAPVRFLWRNFLRLFHATRRFRSRPISLVKTTTKVAWRARTKSMQTVHWNDWRWMIVDRREPLASVVSSWFLRGHARSAAPDDRFFIVDFSDREQDNVRLLLDPL